MKKSEIVLAIVGILLVFCILLGVIFVVSQFEKVSSEAEKTDSIHIPSVTVNADPRIVYDSDSYLGCSVQGNVSTFFIAASAADLVDEDSCSDYWTLSFDKSYSTFQSRRVDGTIPNPRKYSVDGGKTWKDFVYDYETQRYYMAYSSSNETEYVPLGDSIFIAVALEENCSSIDEFFDALTDEFFYEYYPCECLRCGGVYNAYTSFRWEVMHKVSDSGFVG